MAPKREVLPAGAESAPLQVWHTPNGGSRLAAWDEAVVAFPLIVLLFQCDLCLQLMQIATNSDQLSCVGHCIWANRVVGRCSTMDGIDSPADSMRAICHTEGWPALSAVVCSLQLLQSPVRPESGITSWHHYWSAQRKPNCSSNRCKAILHSVPHSATFIRHSKEFPSRPWGLSA